MEKKTRESEVLSALSTLWNTHQIEVLKSIHLPFLQGEIIDTGLLEFVE